MNMPPEYHGPHAKRWTDPDTGRTYSLKPSDYVAVAGAHQARVERRREAQDALYPAGTEAEYLGNTRGPQPTTTYTEAHTIDINIEDTSEEARMEALQAIDRELIRRGWKKNPEADASVEVVPMMGREPVGLAPFVREPVGLAHFVVEKPERLVHFVVEEDGSVRGWRRPVSAREVVERGRGQAEGVMNWLGARRWIRPAAYGAVLVYIIFIIGVTAVSMGGQ